MGASSAVHTGWRRDASNGRLDMYYQGTRLGHITGTTFVLAAGAGMTITDTGLTITAGGQTITAGDLGLTVGNVRLGVANAFATTQPTQALVIESGTAPAGAITTSSALFASDTVLRKIIADGTVSNVQS